MEEFRATSVMGFLERALHIGWSYATLNSYDLSSKDQHSSRWEKA